ncbi:MAG: DUF3048 domain-containing protein [Clostridia bacterium]|nr:DUF3048 domain-containing protein [Clostridia bacterium]
MKRVVSIILAVSLCCCLASCGKKAGPKIKDKTTSTTTTTKTKIYNPLTGISGYSSKMVDKKPVAVMINNVNGGGNYNAQAIQAGVGEADMVFETLVEGGITRLLAVYADISKVGQIGSIRSARISYAQLAAGLDAYYIHCLADNKYCSTSYRSGLGLVDLDLGSNASSLGKRISNGMATEHTLYTFGDKVAKLIDDKYSNKRIKESARNVYKFNDENSPEQFSKSAKNIAVRYSDTQTTYLRYNSDDKKYIRGNRNENMLDYVSGKKEKFKNVLVLFTSVHELPDHHHMKSELNSGTGYYFSEETYKEIKWSKDGETKPLKFFDTDGKDLKLNAGNSYICITDTSNKSKINIESAPTTASTSTAQ